MTTKITTKLSRYEISLDGTNWILIHGVKGFTGLNGGTASIIDTTDFDSTGKEKLQGLPDDGSITLSMFYLPNDPGQAALDTARVSGALVGFRTTLSSLDRFTSQVLVQSFEKMASGTDQVWQGSAKLETSGLSVRDKASS